MNFLIKHRFNPIAIVSAIFLLILLLVGLMWILIPPPPKNIEIATGFPTGLYYQFAQRLKGELAGPSVDDARAEVLLVEKNLEPGGDLLEARRFGSRDGSVIR